MGPCALPRYWLDLAPLSTCAALRTSPLGDLDGSTELAKPPLVGIKRLPVRPAADLTQRGLNAVGAQSGWKCTGMPPPLPHAYLVGAFAAGAPVGLGRGDLEPRRDLVIIGATLYSWGPGGRRGERNRARTAKARARMNPVVITTTLVCRYARGSHPQGHMERVGRPIRCWFVMLMTKF